jgi:nucleoid-associated protein YgaU
VAAADPQAAAPDGDRAANADDDPTAAPDGSVAGTGDPAAEQGSASDQPPIVLEAVQSEVTVHGGDDELPPEALPSAGTAQGNGSGSPAEQVPEVPVEIAIALQDVESGAPAVEDAADVAAALPAGAAQDPEGAAIDSGASAAEAALPSIALQAVPSPASEDEDAESMTGSAQLPSAEAAPVPQTPPLNQDLAIRAAEVETERFYVAGEAAPGTRVRVFADEDFVGEAEAGAEGRWLLEADRDIPVGEVVIRADAVEPEGTDTVAQAEIPFLRYADGIVLEPVVTPAEQEEGDVALETEFPGVSYVIIRRGDNLWRISKRNYGRGLRYQAIFTANKDKIRDPDLIYPGQIFVVPTRDRKWEGEQTQRAASKDASG